MLASIPPSQPPCQNQLCNREGAEAEARSQKSPLNIHARTVSGSCPHVTHTVMPGLVYHKPLPALNSEIAEAFCTHTPKSRARTVIKIGCPAESIFLLMVMRVGGSLSSFFSLLQLVDVGS